MGWLVGFRPSQHSWHIRNYPIFFLYAGDNESRAWCIMGKFSFSCTTWNLVVWNESIYIIVACICCLNPTGVSRKTDRWSSLSYLTKKKSISCVFELEKMGHLLVSSVFSSHCSISSLSWCLIYLRAAGGGCWTCTLSCWLIRSYYLTISLSLSRPLYLFVIFTPKPKKEIKTYMLQSWPAFCSR